VTLRLRSHAGNTQFTEVLGMHAELQPDVFPSNELKGLVLTKVSGQDMVMLALEHTEAEIVDVRNINVVIKMEETIGRAGPVAFGVGQMGCCYCVGQQSSENVGVQHF
jgi:hypothetical protein